MPKISNKNTETQNIFRKFYREAMHGQFIKHLHFFPGHHQNYTEAGLVYTTNFESDQVQKYLTCNQKYAHKIEIMS